MEPFRQALAALFVLGLLGGTLYWLRSRGLAAIRIKGPGRGSGRRMQSLERLTLTPQHSLHLVSVGNRVLLIGVSPGGCTLLDGSDGRGPVEDCELLR